MKTYTLDKPDNLVGIFEETLARFGAREWLGTKNNKNKNLQLGDVQGRGEAY